MFLRLSSKNTFLPFLLYFLLNCLHHPPSFYVFYFFYLSCSPPASHFFSLYATTSSCPTQTHSSASLHLPLLLFPRVSFWTIFVCVRLKRKMSISQWPAGNILPSASSRPFSGGVTLILSQRMALIQDGVMKKQFMVSVSGFQRSVHAVKPELWLFWTWCCACWELLRGIGR